MRHLKLYILVMKILIGRKNHLSDSTEAKVPDFRVRSDHDELFTSNCSQVFYKKAVP